MSNIPHYLIRDSILKTDNTEPDPMMHPRTLDRREFCRAAVASAASVTACGLGATSAHAATFEADELCYMSAAELLPLFRSGKLSPVDLLKAQIARFEAVGEKTNSVTYTHFDTALAQAKVSEKRYGNGTARALEGITVGVKDEHHDKGWIVTRGSVLLKDNKMDRADPIVTKLKRAGAVLNIQTTAPEFYMSGVTYSKLWGVSRCPWNTNYAVGGSSGGSGGSLAAGLCTLATGSDMGGSIRLPCAYNGLYGFKPPFGRVVTESTLSHFSGTGPMARTFDDMVAMMNVLSGQTPHEPGTISKLFMPREYRPIKGMRIANVGSMGLVPLDKDARQGFAGGVDDLKSLGAEVDDVSLEVDWAEMVEKFIGGVMAGPMGAGLAADIGRIDEMTTYAAYFAKKAVAPGVGSTQAAEFEAYVRSLYAKISDAVFSKGYDAIVMPSLATPHVPADYDVSKEGFELEGHQMHKSFILALTVPWNVLNWCPVVNVPTRLSSQGMPTGMQIIGKPYHDLQTFQIAHAYKSVAPRLFSGENMPDFRR
ncbi:Glutamyl-tRNA(Gln) amidotransferase subunit A [Planctomycetes bacterium CA13]|uniref:Glutamyl-tRNA(Gln) amidotransferase subunit A n=1 Tax=Novipirellula herctigrandis TaxID=2527986 RepID=A0A5C5Z1S1_9BACT|nr:Glutamyl-tRNA(Gln) amidotransferase subunit A [Planctomycetes bacterium CA13]